MIRVSQQWAVQIDITNACHLHCSNCTRLLDHAKPRYFMSVDCFERAINALKNFPRHSEPCPQGRRKVIGLIGGEPLLHPELPAIIDAFIEAVPEVYYRGFWTSKDWKTGAWEVGFYRAQVERLIGPEGVHSTDVRGPSVRHKGGFLNWNMHLPEMDVRHQPLLVAIKDVITDEKQRWEMISDCWVQREWSSTATDKGFFFCEVAGHFDQVFQGPGGLPFDENVWLGDLNFVRDENGVPRPQGKFAEQINRWCERCGACLRLPGRLDSENRDDVSHSNLVQLQAIGSPRVAKGEIVPVETEAPYAVREQRKDWVPFQYVKGARPADQSAAAREAKDRK